MMHTVFLPRRLYRLLSCLRRSLHALLLALILVAPVAVAATATFSVGLDTDNNAATGCALATVNGPVSGIEQVATTVVSTSATGASVIRLERQVCVGGTLGAPVVYDSGTWPVGLGNGTGGSAVIETSIPRSLLPAAGTMRAVVIAGDGSGGQDATATFALALAPVAIAPVVPVPLSPWLVLPLSLLLLVAAGWWRRRHPQQTALLVLLVFVAGSGLVWAASAIRDGNVGDWTGVAPAVTDAAGDAPVNADIVAVFTQQDGTNLYVRIDADVRRDAAVNQAPVVSAGTAQTITLPATANLSGSATDDGLPNPPATVTYAWTKVSGPGNVAFGNAASAATSASFDAAGSYVLRLTASDSALSASADVTLTVNPVGAANQAPVVNAGPNLTVTLPGAATLSGSATDDGLPNPPATLSFAWTKVSGPGTVIFGNAASAATSASFSVAGSYVLRLTASDSALAGTADVTITVQPIGTANQAPIVSAGANQSITLPASATLAGTATDDGLPNPPGALTTTWSLVSGPVSGVVFGNPAALATTATFAAPGTYVLRLTANDGATSVSSTVQITVADGAPQMAAIADRTVQLGSRVQVLLEARDGNANDVLTYTLTTAPAGASLNPAPLIDWVPTAAQLGPHTFTAKVTDSSGNAATTTFNVTVVHTNQPPQLAPQASLITPVGTAFARTLTASDPDAGDVLTFTLVSGPSGMTLNGGVLNWSTSGRNPGDYGVTVRVADVAGLYDQKTFTVTLQQSAPAPLAKDDSYEARLGQTLTIPAAGVLGNDVSYSGNPLSAIKLSDPDKGTLDAFNADGGFTYTAPATLPPAPGLNPVVSWRGVVVSNNRFALAADLDHDGVVDHVSSTYGDFRAWRGSDGAQLWQFDKSITTHADISGCGTYINSEQFALGDVTGGGDIYLFASVNCDTLATAGKADRYFAANASQILAGGKVATQWVSPRLSQPHPGAYATNASPTLPNPPVTPTYAASASGSVPALAKLTAGGATKLVTRFLAASTYGYYYDQPNSAHLAYAACRTITGLPADEGRACKATFVIDAATGAIDQVLTAPNPADESGAPRNSPTDQNIPIIADLDGDGQVEIISGGDVWKLVGGVWTLAWQAQFDAYTGPQKSFEPSSVAVADLDGDGKAEVVFHLLANYYQAGGVYIFNHDGSLRRKIPISTNVSGLLSVADVDGDGAPEILVAADSFLYVYRPDGSLLWAKRLPDILAGVVPPISSGGTEPMTSDSQLYVYDLDLDGVPEVIVQGTRRLFILNGRTGAELWSIDTENDGFFQPGNPILVDADGDGHVDIIVHLSERWNCGFYGSGPGGCKGNAMRISGGNNNWAPGPKVQNQLNFRPAASDDAAKILYDASVRRDFRQQAQQGTVIDPRIAQGTTFTYKANDGSADSAPATVRIDIKPPNRPPVITSTPPTGLLSVTPYTRRVYTITATDPDPGDTVHYEFVSSTFDTTYFPAPTVDPVTGGVDIYSGPCGSYGGACDFGRVLVNVAAVDSHGARTEQSFFVDITYVSVAVPNVIGQLLPAADAAIEAAKLTPLVVTELFGTQPAGTVVGQDPLPGTANVPRSATVRLTVSKGPQPVLLPFVVGQPLATVNAQLTGAGLTVNVSTTFSTTIPAGEIMRQSPVAGTELSPATAPPVNLTVSAGGPLPAPIASIVLEPGPGPMLRLAGDELQYRAVAILTDGTSADVTLTAAWLSSLTGVATVNTAGVAKAITAGATTISASLSGKTGQGTLNVASRALGDNTPPTAAITSPADGGSVTGPTAIVGTASDANFLRYELAIALAGDETYTLIAEGTTAVTNGTLGTLDPTTLVNDLYTLRLTVFDRSENQSVATRTVQVSGGLKVGLFTLTYQDLNIPAAGIPLTIHRTYDSRDKRQGDFGIGWQLGLQTLRLRTNRVLGTGWVRTVVGPLVSLVPTSEHKVSLTLTGGRVEEFDMSVSPTSNLGSLDFTNVTGFLPRPGTLGQLQALGNNSLLIVNGGAEEELVDDATLNTYTPTLYRYTDADGTQIEISPTEGVKKVTDSNGNAVMFGPSGIQHSNGTGIAFTRDGKGRIVAITDALGNVQTYGYDGNGDLVTHTNPVGGVSRFAYDRNHGLVEIHDALGMRVTRSDYDGSGRLIAMTDADGKQITFTHNTGAQQEIITDRLGNINQVLYDASGNVLSSQRGVTIEGVLVAAVTTMTYDGQHNETSLVDPDGRRTSSTYSGVLQLTRVVDPTGLNLGAAFAYNAGNDLTNATDPGGRAFNFAYDANGNVTSFNTPLAGASTSVANSQGLPIQNRDALGNTTAMTRDAAGRVTREDVLDAASVLLRRVDFTYDANGNKTSVTLYRTVAAVLTPLTTTYAYDVANRLVAVTDPMGGVARIEYDLGDRVNVRIDPLGRRTTFTYDTLSRLVRTTYPDGTFESSTYDAESNAVATTDRAGRTTIYAYDELKRQVKATLADGSSTQTIYSPGGRVAATIDANGNRTDYAYDTAGRRTSTTLPAVVNGTSGGPPVRPQVATALNALGRPVSATDPNGRVTSFQYDVNGRLTQMTYPGGSTVRQTYDTLGRRTSVTNEEGQSTSFGYDGLGRLISVSGLAGNATYAYDEASNLLTQTDALGRITRFRYDALSRMVEKTYPGGEAERYAYDAVGNLVTHTDGLGRTTTFVYDAMSRMTSKLLPGGVTIAYSYKPDGQRATVTDPRGVTTLGYDSVGRLVSVTHPTGETVSYARDANGNLLSLASPAATVSYGYDALNRLLQVNSPEGQSSAFYDLVGNRVRQTAANGIVTDASFDARDRPTSLTHKSASSAVLRSFANVYSPAGRRSQVTEQDGSVEVYTYDAKGRLSAEVRTGSNPFNISHSYDAVGNRTQMVRGSVPTVYSYDSDDRLQSDGASTYTYDANGNLVTRTNGASVTQFGYDAENRLITVLGDSIASQYAYDADGNRVLASTSSGLARFLVDDANNTGLSQVLEERSGDGSLLARYSYGNELLAMARVGGASFHLRDVHGSARGLADATGAITDSYTYDAYGNAVAATGSTVNPYRFSGERLDTDTGFYQLRERYYNPAQGRFMSRDPFSGRVESPVSRQRYLYADADPVNRMDPTGRETLTELSFVQGLQTILNNSYRAQVAAQFCNLGTKVDMATTAFWATSVMIGTAIFGVEAYGLMQVDAKGKLKGTLNLGYETPELQGTKGLKKAAMALTGGGGAANFEFNFDFHGMPSVKVVFGLYPPPVKIGPQLVLAEEYLKREFRYCGSHGPLLGSIVLKGELAGGGEYSLEGPKATAGYALGIEASLFRGAVKFGLPLMSINYVPELKFEWLMSQ